VPASRSAALVRSFGLGLDEMQFNAEWDEEFARHEAAEAADLREFSMHDVARIFLSRRMPAAPTAAQVDAVVETYLEEWNAGVRYVGPTADTIAALASQHCLVVVTNTHHRELVPRHLAAMGVAGLISQVVTSVQVGRRKPHPSIYAEALSRSGAVANATVFVGDTFDADFAGPEAVGIAAFLIDPSRRHDVPESRRLASLADLPGQLARYCG
jgi:putative hydrolase of the HAD superfamily